MDDWYDYSKSSTAIVPNCTDALFDKFSCQCQTNRCGFSISYTEGSSLDGYFIDDMVEIGIEEFEIHNGTHEPSRLRFLIGCTQRETDMFKQQKADGILGLGFNSNSKSQMPNLIDYAFSSQESSHLAFSLCFAENGGYLGVGGFNFNKHLKGAPIQVMQLSQGHGHSQYNVNVMKVKVNGKLLPLEKADFDRNQGTFIDSGATLSCAHDTVAR